VGGGDGGVVEEAEAHRPRTLGVVAGRAQAAEGEPVGPAEQPLRGLGGSAGGVQGGLVGTCGCDRVEIDRTPARRRERLDRGDVLGRVDSLELLGGRGRCLDALGAEPVGGRQPLLDRLEAPGVLGMGAGVVLVGAGMREVERDGADTVRACRR
jgi:hypothetical protein